MILWSELVHEVQPHVPGCPEMMIEDALRQSAKVLCRGSHLWEEQLPSIYPVSSITKYQLSVPDEAEVLSISSLQHVQGGHKSRVDVWPSVNVFGLLSFMESPSSSRGPIEVKAILMPSKTARGMPDRIITAYQDGIVSGAVGRLQLMPNKDWTNPELAGINLKLLDNAINEAKLRKPTGNTDCDMRVRPVPFV